MVPALADRLTIGTPAHFFEGGRHMRYAAMAVVWCVMVLLTGTASAQGALIETVAKGCEKELTTFCGDVTAGEGRGLACLYAYSDKLSPRCEYALYEAASQLERAINALAFAVNECRDDLNLYCADIKPGGGRLLKCLEKNDPYVSKRCKAALKDTGLK